MYTFNLDEGFEIKLLLVGVIHLESLLVVGFVLIIFYHFVYMDYKGLVFFWEIESKVKFSIK